MTAGRTPAVAALVVAIAACGAPPRPDHGSYVTTAAVPQTVKRFEYPRAKRLLIASPSDRLQCVREWVERDLHGKGIALAAAASDRTDAVLVLAIGIESVEGPGPSWNPFSGAITSSHQRTDISLAIHEPGSATALWRTQTRLRAALNCPDQELRTQLQQLLDNVR